MACSRRSALSGLGGALIVGCSGDSSGDDSSIDAAAETGDEPPPDCSGTAGMVVGAETDFAVGTWSLVGTSSQNPVIVSQDPNGFYAYSAICTHQGCLVNSPTSNGTAICPCHGSEFDGNGQVIFGPAFQPLQHFAVNICGGSVFVDPSTPVSAGVRTAPQ